MFVFSNLSQVSGTKPNAKITNGDYEQWKKRFTFDALKGKKYGESFCDYFKIHDYRILFASHTDADRLIQKNWVC